MLLKHVPLINSPLNLLPHDDSSRQKTVLAVSRVVDSKKKKKKEETYEMKPTRTANIGQCTGLRSGRES